MSINKKAACLFAALVIGTAGAASAYETPRDNELQFKVRALGVFPAHKKIKTQVGETKTKSDQKLRVKKQAGVDFSTSMFFNDQFSTEFGISYMPFNIKGIKTKRSSMVPLSLTAKFHTPEVGAFSPYIGAGIHYTMINMGKLKNDTDVAEYGVKKLKFKNQLGPVAQLGADFTAANGVGFNIDMKYYWLKLKNKKAANHTNIQKSAKINPFVVGLGFSFKM